MTRNKHKNISKLLFRGFILLWLFLPLGQLIKLPLDIPGISIYLTDLIILLILIFWILNGEKFPLSLKRKLTFLRPALFFITFAFLTWLINLFRWGVLPSLSGGLYLIRWLLYASLFPVLADILKVIPKWSKSTSKIIIFSMIIIALLGMVQYIVYPNLSFLIFSGWDPHIGRIAGTLLDPGYTGLLLVLGLIMVVVSSKSPWKWLLAFFLYLALALTYSRSAYLSFLATCFFFSWQTKKLAAIFIGLIMIAVTVLLLPRTTTVGTQLEREDSAVSRWVNYQETWQIVKKSPLVGVGFNNMRLARLDKGLSEEGAVYSHSEGGSDSSFLFVLATCGPFGLWFYLKMIKEYWSGKNSVWQPIFQLSTVAIVTHSFFNNSSFYFPVLIYWWTILAAKFAETSDGK